MTVEMTDRLERALKQFADWHYGRPGPVLQQNIELLAAYREARDAPKAQRFEAGQQVVWNYVGGSKVLRLETPAWYAENLAVQRIMDAVKALEATEPAADPPGTPSHESQGS